jgi:hypothetical protein
VNPANMPFFLPFEGHVKEVYSQIAGQHKQHVVLFAIND